ncbi:hypothetical protein [Photobacterium damselae]|uniref:hypothetical protein n=1 Tax=Photobacterium damselae TaxID=38293 RepID=UPI001F27F4C9|nr:hypothetical protein [Photobacterium damselae]UKA04988.1 hypothetical protein IHC89_22340 [Photobacterium damselae subsp. damselae]
MARIKLYSGVVTYKRETYWAYANTTSKENAAKLISELTGAHPTHIKPELSIVSNPTQHEHADLEFGTAIIEPTQTPRKKSTTIREMDIGMIGDVSIITSAERMLQSCTIQEASLKKRLEQIRQELIDLKIDLKENILERYSSYKRDN